MTGWQFGNLVDRLVTFTSQNLKNLASHVNLKSFFDNVDKLVVSVWINIRYWYLLDKFYAVISTHSTQFIHSSFLSFVHSFCLFIHYSILSFGHWFFRSFIRSFVYSSIYPIILSSLNENQEFLYNAVQ